MIFKVPVIDDAGPLVVIILSDLTRVCESENVH